jgi:hypothetical protein
MSSGGEMVCILGTTENAKVLIGRCGAIESHVRALGVWNHGGESVKQMCGNVERVFPKACRNRSLKQEGADDIVSVIDNVLDFTVLR